MAFYEILSQRRKEKGISFEELSELSSVPTSTLKKILTGVTKAPGIETLKAITYALGLTLEDLDDTPTAYSSSERDFLQNYRRLDVYGQRAVLAVMDVELARVQDADTVVSSSVVTLRRYMEPAAAGVPLWTEGDYEYFDYPSNLIPDGTDYAVGVTGHSMEPDYPDGCTVFVKRCNRAHDGDVVIAWLDGEGTVIKRVVAPFGRVEYLESINPNYSNLSGPQLEGMRIYGKVLGIAR